MCETQKPSTRPCGSGGDANLSGIRETRYDPEEARTGPEETRQDMISKVEARKLVIFPGTRSVIYIYIFFLKSLKKGR